MTDNYKPRHKGTRAQIDADAAAAAKLFEDLVREAMPEDALKAGIRPPGFAQSINLPGETYRHYSSTDKRTDWRHEFRLRASVRHGRYGTTHLKVRKDRTLNLGMIRRAVEACAEMKMEELRQEGFRTENERAFEEAGRPGIRPETGDKREWQRLRREVPGQGEVIVKGSMDKADSYKVTMILSQPVARLRVDAPLAKIEQVVEETLAWHGKLQKML